ncbi:MULTISPECIES: WXG100-like domain-containing protein [Actinoplanes]|uniref:Uncharacterized protein n=2 Tax=Actinoplanes TaxID=1865 RepID=A0A0X3UZA8_9ACTN|nr:MULTISPECIES: hypothetical protein [Actinoplanes]KUL37853.1 hypothetical protein ADL15_11105 [Actinoplanes awajinensis subsp. mycoplanecinus]GIE68803.1 hypothetical protein Apa02nite_049110 [Actinoplanes palleronii]
MVDLRGISEDVPYDREAADRLAGQLRAAADACDGQIPRRTTIASHAAQEWRGVYARQFGTRMDICTGDARRLATAMRQAAQQVDELSRLAAEEQSRREKARAWQQQQEDEGVLDKIGDFFFGEDDLPPIPDPVTPPRFTSPAPATAARE